MWSLSTTTLTVLLLVPSLAYSQKTPARSSKRGLIYITSKDSTKDSTLFTQSSSDISWYYNYGSAPDSSIPSDRFNFVPMLWGATAGSNPSTDTSFLNTIITEVSTKSNITHILTFNEPDGTKSTGGSDVAPETAATYWKSNIVPLRTTHGLKVGLPAVTGSPQGLAWLEAFNSSCEVLLPSTATSKGTTNSPVAGCIADFIPIHFYGDFTSLASYIGQIRALYPTLPIWITEFALAHAKESDTQSYLNETLDYLDRLAYVDRYSYFGSFRQAKSNVGKEAAMIDNKGHLTKLGEWYVGVTSDKVQAQVSAASASLTTRSTTLMNMLGGRLAVSLGLVGVVCTLFL